ncbi:MAG: histidine phosphatase family protein [Ignavibacterium album]|uniref:SixA phosphatase family protein n=1 Tax=Ignavibacterium album TaxID=591197 RepID=UPI0026ED5528|nr:histidine phosphatase family protein [Ignavibacterium album]MBI5661104.1 histidine phosphatase family protein [Ignavibacterium album]
MRQLILIRHAKSSWSNPDLSDFDRPLNKRGKRDLAFMSVLLSQKNITPELIISSPALRTKLTAIEFANKIGYNKNEIIWNKNLYLASYMKILKIIKQIENKINCAIIVGHNPGLTDLQNYLCNEEIDNIPTSGIVSMSTIKEWIDVESKDFELVFFEFPKKIS